MVRYERPEGGKSLQEILRGERQKIKNEYEQKYQNLVQANKRLAESNRILSASLNNITRMYERSESRISNLEDEVYGLKSRVKELESLPKYIPQITIPNIPLIQAAKHEEVPSFKFPTFKPISYMPTTDRNFSSISATKHEEEPRWKKSLIQPISIPDTTSNRVTVFDDGVEVEHYPNGEWKRATFPWGTVDELNPDGTHKKTRWTNGFEVEYLPGKMIQRWPDGREKVIRA